MATNLPGKSYEYMVGLLNQNAGVLGPTPLSIETMLSIFWEETFFNNILQTGAGHAVGFGQTEPAEFYRFDAHGSLSGLVRHNGFRRARGRGARGWTCPHERSRHYETPLKAKE